MSDSIPRKFRRGDTSPEHLGRVFYQYKLGKEYWVTPEVFEKSNALRKKLIKKWHKAHPEKLRASVKKWATNPKNLELKRRVYRDWSKTVEGKIVKRRIYHRHLSTVNGMLSNRLRSRICHSLKRGYTKSASTLELIGCSIKQFREHLESQFEVGMSWKNWSKWEIDHRVPLSSFNLADPEQQKLAFNYHNCRPMWREANRQKSDKIEGELFRGRDIRKILPFKAA